MNISSHSSHSSILYNQHHFIRIPGSHRIVTQLPSLLTPIGPCFEAVVIIHSVRIHQHHPVSPAFHILSHLSSIVSSLAVFIYYYYSFSSIFIKSPALPCIVHTLPLPPCNKTLLNPTYFVSLALADRTTCKRKENRKRERKKKKQKESKGKEPKRYTHSEQKVHPPKKIL